MSIPTPHRSRPILKRPGRPIQKSSDVKTSPDAQPTLPPVFSEPEELAPEPALVVEEEEGEVLEEASPSGEPNLDAASELEQLPEPQGRALDWSGFPVDMGAAIAKELLTDWRFDC